MRKAHHRRTHDEWKDKKRKRKWSTACVRNTFAALIVMNAIFCFLLVRSRLSASPSMDEAVRALLGSSPATKESALLASTAVLEQNLSEEGDVRSAEPDWESLSAHKESAGRNGEQSLGPWTPGASSDIEADGAENPPGQRSNVEKEESRRRIDKIFAMKLISAAERDFLMHRVEKGANLGIVDVSQPSRNVTTATNKQASSNLAFNRSRISPHQLREGDVADLVPTSKQFRVDHAGRYNSSWMDIPRSTEGTTKVLERNNIPLAGVSPRPRVQEVPLCGNARREDGEECDDGNIARFDGCSPSCRVETGWSCYRRQAADEAAGDECLEASPEDVLFVVNFVGRSSPRSGVLNYDRDLCLSDCSHCLSQHIDRECHGYCYHGISESYRNCSFFGADCRDEITGETIQELCVFKEYDAIARCAFHARCTAVVCFNTNDLHPAVDSKRLCIAYDASLAEIRSRNGARFEVRDDVKRMDPWVYVPICQSAACTTIFLPPKMEHRMYMLGENEINQTRAAIQYTDELVRRSILEREKIQQTLNLIGRGLARGHGTEHKLAGQITQWMKNETALVEERLKMSERLQVPFRRSTIVSTLTVQEWEEQQKSRLNRRKIVAGARDIGSLSERKRPGRS